MQSVSTESESAAWMQIAPMLDTAMAQLGEKDHNALVLRFFEGRNFKDVSAALDTSEAGARMRVSRALGRLRSFFKKRGIALSVSVIAGAISANSVQAAPIGLATSVTIAAVKGTVVTTTALTLLETTLKLMAWTKLKTTAVVAAIAIVAAGTATVTISRFNARAKPPAYAFAGYATPEATIQSSIWAGSVGDFNKFLEGCTPEQVARFRNKMAGKSDDAIRREAIAWAGALTGYQITQKEIVSDSEVHLHISAPPSAEGLRNGDVTVIMKKSGTEWKQDGDR